MSWAVLRRERKAAAAPVAAAPPKPEFVCRTCGAADELYEAREVVNWNAIGAIYRKPDGGFTYRTYNRYLPGDPGPPLRFVCINCNTYAETLDALIEGNAEEELLHLSSPPAPESA